MRVFNTLFPFVYSKKYFERKKIPTFERKKRLQLKIKTEVTIDGCDIEDPCESGLVGTFEDFEDSFFISDFHCFKKFLLMYSHTLELKFFIITLLFS